jgi:rhodanese-related sulfurtransferase
MFQVIHVCSSPLNRQGTLAVDISTISQYSYYKFYPVIAMLVILVLGCASTDGSFSISGSDLADQIDTGKAPLILDTRSRSEYNSGHVPGALFFPFWKAFFADDAILQRCKKEPVVVYCQHGPRASVAKFALRRIGCDKVIVLEDHLSGWIAQELPLTRMSKQHLRYNK